MPNPVPPISVTNPTPSTAVEDDKTKENNNSGVGISTILNYGGLGPNRRFADTRTWGDSGGTINVTAGSAPNLAEVNFTNTDKAQMSMSKVTLVGPTANGCRIKVDTVHRYEDEKVSLILQARVRTQTEERMVNLALLAENVALNPKGFAGQGISFDINYDEINTYLANHNANLRVTPDAPLAVVAVFNHPTRGPTAPHQSGGFKNAGGTFMAPAPSQSAADIRANPNAGIAAAKLAPIDLDIGIPWTPELWAQYPCLLRQDPANPQNKGQFQSRMEAEPKYHVPLERVGELRDKLTELAKPQNQPLRDKVLGPGWSITVVDDYFERDAQGIKNDGFGRPITSPMTDVYPDDEKMSLASKEIGLRFRSRANNTIGLVNIKIPGAIDNGIQRRIEYGLQVNMNVVNDWGQMQKFFESSEHLNPFRFVRQMLPDINVADVLKPAIKIDDKRYLFRLQHQDGTKIEVSVDDVISTSLRHNDPSGNPLTGRYAQLEMDLEHMATSSANVQSNTASGFQATGFDTDADQETWLKGLPSTATLFGPPRIHEPDDVNNPSLVNAPGYHHLQDINPKLSHFLLGNEIETSGQKCHVAAEVMGLLPLSAAKKKQYAEELAAREKLDSQGA